MAITAKDVMALRQRTGLGMMECKQALNDAQGDVEKAIALLKERLGSKMQERDVLAGEGALGVVTGNGSVVMVEVRSETDFAARNDSFKAGVQKCAEAALALPDGAIEPNDAIKAAIEDLRITIKENISFARGIKLSGAKIGAYIHHNGKLGAVVTAEGEVDEDLLKGICQHLIAADGRGALALPMPSLKPRPPASPARSPRRSPRARSASGSATTRCWDRCTSARWTPRSPLPTTSPRGRNSPPSPAWKSAAEASAVPIEKPHPPAPRRRGFF
jgi:hypothetical protein